MEDKKDDLLSFRNDWMDELCKKKRNDNESTSGTSSSSGETLKVKKPHTIPAFELANNYLNSVEKDCKYCSIESTNALSCEAKGTSTQYANYCDKESKRDRRLSSNSKKRKAKKLYMEDIFEKKSLLKKKGENFLDLLISDIDEITCIPFFDNELPKELALNVFRYLSVDDLSNCCLVNTQWKVLAEDDLLWFNICPILDVERDVECVVEKTGWKNYIKEYVLERRRIQRKWKERFCEVMELENEKAGILCSTSIFDHFLLTAYLDGTVKIWDLMTGKFGHNLKEQYTSDEDIVTSMCSRTSIIKNICAAGFQNGDLMIWKRTGDVNGQLVFMQNYDSAEIQQIILSAKYPCICFSNSNKFTVIRSHHFDIPWKWETVLNKIMNDKIQQLLLTDDSSHIIVCTRNELKMFDIQQDICSTVETLIGATFSCILYKKQHIIAGISSFGYSILGGYRIRKYCIDSGKQIANLIGSQVMITCLNDGESYGNRVVIGCSDNKLRIHDFVTEELQLVINGIGSEITTLQMDKWKIISGHVDGTICLWDCLHGTLYWQSQQKHPVRLCHFDEDLLTTVNLPNDKYPQNSYWYADDLMQHRKHRGSIRVMDFSKDTIADSVPKEFHAEYDNITGYDYNIELIAPYDNVDTYNLPKI